jgi:hypothetical protein
MFFTTWHALSSSLLLSALCDPEHKKQWKYDLK